MICERCSESDVKSDVWEMGGGTTTVVYSPTFYDDCPATGCSREALMETKYHEDYLDTQGVVR